MTLILTWDMAKCRGEMAEVINVTVSYLQDVSSYHVCLLSAGNCHSILN